MLHRETYLAALKFEFQNTEVTGDEWQLLTKRTDIATCSSLDAAAPGLVNVLEFDIVFSLPPSLFRRVLPNFLFGLVFDLEEEENPILPVVFSDLVNFPDMTYWGDNFIERWCGLNEAQLNLIAVCLDTVKDGLLWDHDYDRAKKTLEALRTFTTSC